LLIRAPEGLQPSRTTHCSAHTTNLAAAVSSSADFPGVPVIRPTLLRRCLRLDEDGFSSCSACPCHRAVPTYPAGVTGRLGQPAVCHAGFAPKQRAQPPESYFFEATTGFTDVTAR